VTWWTRFKELISLTEPEISAKRQGQKKDLAVEMFWSNKPNNMDNAHNTTKARKFPSFLDPTAICLNISLLRTRVDYNGIKLGEELV